MIETKHYLKRMKERGFNQHAVQCIFNYGEWNYRGDRLIITKESKEKMLSDIKIIQNKIHIISKKKEFRNFNKFLKKELKSILKVVNKKSSVLVIKESHLITIY